MSVFRAYDIRGIVDEDFDLIRVERLGRACGHYFRERGHRHAVIGHDCRLSSPGYAAALSAGMAAMGLDVIGIGMVPTPVLYFAVGDLNHAAGVMITASHNPPQYNGFKIWEGKSTIYGEELQILRRLYEADCPPATLPGLISRADVIPEYEAAVLSRVTLSRPLKVVVDGGNGAGGELCARLLSRMGAEVIPLYCRPDGTFPNHHPDPVIEENMRDLKAAVLEHKADLGLGLDGDADRLGVMDESGRLLCGDEVLAVYAHELLARCPGATIIGDVKCSDRLFADIKAHGGEGVMSPTGHSLIKARMQELGAQLAGEMSGHLFFKDGWFGFDDAVYGAARFLDIFSRLQAPASTLPRWPQAFTTREINIPCPEERKPAVMRALKAHFKALYPVLEMDGARVRFPQGWGLVRPSNTQPVLVTRYEADSPEALQSIQDEVGAALHACLRMGSGTAE